MGVVKGVDRGTCPRYFVLLFSHSITTPWPGPGVPFPPYFFLFSRRRPWGWVPKYRYLTIPCQILSGCSDILYPLGYNTYAASRWFPPLWLHSNSTPVTQSVRVARNGQPTKTVPPSHDQILIIFTYGSWFKLSVVQNHEGRGPPLPKSYLWVTRGTF